jgi:hypothetical protein
MSDLVSSGRPGGRQLRSARPSATWLEALPLLGHGLVPFEQVRGVLVVRLPDA